MDVEITIREFRRRLHALGYAETTVDAYRKSLREFTTYLTVRGITDLRTVNRQVIQDYKQAVMDQNNSRETKALKLRPVKRLFEYLLKNNRLLLNPTEGLVETCRKNRKIQPVLTVQEMEKLLHQPNLSLRVHIRNRAVMEVLYSTGIRLDELLSLTVHDPDLREKTLFVRKGKGRKQRLVPLGKNAIGYLREYLEKIRPRYATKNPGERILFLAGNGKPLQAAAIRQAIRGYRIAAGIEKSVSPHTFRRSCATHLLQQGADIRYIQELLGHSRLSTTQLYTKVMPVEVKQAHQRYHPGTEEILS
jgi:integrase/recombinase XerD